METHICRSDEMTPLETSSVDRVFISNFFEHVPREGHITPVDDRALVEAFRVDRPAAASS